MTMANLSFLNHAIRKALCLSMVEMAVLDQVESLSNKPSTKYTCIKSPDKIADDLDIGRATVFRALVALTEKGYIYKKKRGYSPTDFIRELVSSEEVGLILKSNKGYLITAKVRELMEDAGFSVKQEPRQIQSQNETPLYQNDTDQSQNDTWEVSKCDNHIVTNVVTNVVTHLEIAEPLRSPAGFEYTGSSEDTIGLPPQSERSTPSPDIPPTTPNPELRAAPLPPSSPMGTKHPAYRLLVDVQDVWLKSRGHGGTKMDGKEGKMLKALIPHIESQVRADGDDPTPENVTGYMGWLYRVSDHIPEFERKSLLDWGKTYSGWNQIVEEAIKAVKKNPFLARNMNIDDTLKHYDEIRGDQTENIAEFAKTYGTTENPESWAESYLAAQGRCLLRWKDYSPVDILRRKAQQYRDHCTTNKSIMKGVKRWLDEDGWVAKYGVTTEGRVSK